MCLQKQENVKKTMLVYRGYVKDLVLAPTRCCNPQIDIFSAQQTSCPFFPGKDENSHITKLSLPSFQQEKGSLKRVEVDTHPNISYILSYWISSVIYDNDSFVITGPRAELHPVSVGPRFNNWAAA